MTKGLFLAGLALVAPGIALAQSAKDAPMAPSGKWVADFGGGTSCVLSRDYGTGDSEKLLMFRPMPGDDYLEIALVMPYKGDPFARNGVVTLMMRPGNQKASGPFRDYTLAGGHRMIDFSLLRTDIVKLSDSTALEFSFVNNPLPPAMQAKMPKAENPPPVKLALSSAAGAMKAIGDCEEQLLQKWGFDPAALRAIKHKAEPIGVPAKWVTMADYPAAALAKHEAGIVRFHYRIDTSGMPQDCAIFQSSGSAELDATTCKLFLERARYKPARGADGMPVASLQNEMFTWAPPRAGGPEAPKR